MPTLPSAARRVCRLSLAACCFTALAGCTQPLLRAMAYDIHVRLEPPAHRLDGRTVVALEPARGAPFARGPAVLEFALNRALVVTTLAGEDAEVRAHTVRPPDGQAGAGDGPALLALHRVELDHIGRRPRLVFEYGGALIQDVQAGEKRGQVHNLLMAAHLGPEGIYLDEGGGWYPSVYQDPARPRGMTAQFTLTAEPVNGMQLVASASLDEQASQAGERLVWRGKYPMTGMVLVGGPHEVKERQAGPVRIALHYSPPADPQSRAQLERHTDMFLAAAEKYLGLYQPLVGPYPFEDYTIVENFFSSGFAFPEFTLLNKALLAMGPRGLMHGMLDHEMLHSWWGNSIYVDPADGNWCEALTTYSANYYGYVLDGDERGARNARRNFCVAVSRIKPEEDLPLGTFGLRSAGQAGAGTQPAAVAGREIGYSKGAMVFYMLADQIGQDKFWAACRALTQGHRGRFANWKTLQSLFEKQSGANLTAFFEQWVRRSGTPEIRLESATQRGNELSVTLRQMQAPPFELRIPLRVALADGSHADHVVRMAEETCMSSIALEQPARAVVLDPDFHVLRRLRPEEIVPAVATTRAARKLLILKPAGEISPFYQRVIEDFTGEPGAKEVTVKNAVEFTAAEAAGQSVLIIGDAVRALGIQALLARVKCPLQFLPPGEEPAGFKLDETMYVEPGHAVLCTLHHPDLPGGGITVYCGNSETAIGRSDLLLHYRDSLVVFETSSRKAEGPGGESKTVYESRPIARRDFESPASIEVTQDAAGSPNEK
ncbi:MAG: M1 family aminopeptidase [Planctomycetota bacterium]